MVTSFFPVNYFCSIPQNNDLTGSGDNTEKMNIAIETLHLPNGQKENAMNDSENNVCAPANIGTTERKGNKSIISGM